MPLVHGRFRFGRSVDYCPHCRSTTGFPEEISKCVLERLPEVLRLATFADSHQLPKTLDICAKWLGRLFRAYPGSYPDLLDLKQDIVLLVLQAIPGEQSYGYYHMADCRNAKSRSRRNIAFDVSPAVVTHQTCAASEVTCLASRIPAGVRLRMACSLHRQCRNCRIFGGERERSKPGFACR